MVREWALKTRIFVWLFRKLPPKNWGTVEEKLMVLGPAAQQQQKNEAANYSRDGLYYVVRAGHILSSDYFA